MHLSLLEGGSHPQGAVESHRTQRRWLAKAIFALDDWLCRQQGIFEYAAESNCIFRLQQAVACETIALSDGTKVHTGDAVLALHIWSEHMPTVGPRGATLAWAHEVRAAVDRSLVLLATYLARCRGYDHIVAIRADIALGSAERAQQIARIAGRFGFEPVSVNERRDGFLHRAGENILLFLLVAASNPFAARAAALRREHILTYLSRRGLERRYRRADDGRADDEGQTCGLSHAAF